MASKDPPSTERERVQVYLEKEIAIGLKRQAKVSGLTLSGAAGRAIARDVKRSPAADHEDRLLQLERSLRDHMRSSSRDAQINQELIVEVARMIASRVPETYADEEPTAKAAMRSRIERMFDDVARRVVRGREGNGHAESVPFSSQAAE